MLPPYDLPLLDALAWDADFAEAELCPLLLMLLATLDVEAFAMLALLALALLDAFADELAFAELLLALDFDAADDFDAALALLAPAPFTLPVMRFPFH